MAVDVLMPNLGFDTQSGRLLEWLRQPGDAVAKGEPIAIVESDKANVELEAVASGVLLEQRAQAGEEVAVGAVIGRIGAASERTPAPAAAPAPAPVAASTPAQQRVSPLAQRVAQQQRVPLEQVAGTGERGRVLRRDVEAYQAARSVGDGLRVLALPRVRRAARQLGIDLAAVLAAGYPNPITLDALHAYQAAASAPPEPAAAATTTAAPPAQDGVTIVPLSRMRQTIGRRLSESMREAPHFYVTGEFVFDAALERLKTLPGKVRINDLIAWLTTQALLRVPRLNATYSDGAIRQYEGVHLAVAVAREDGLLTPVLRGAERYSPGGLAAELRALIERTRAGRLSPDELSGGSFTISNMGMIAQVDHFTAVINPPQVGILAVGALKPRSVVENGGLFIRQTAHLTLSGDHRAVDGMDLARFMTAFGEALDRFAQ
jgi:pyruvate dehydrogenase E2 component (dihydrolipoamide acetyltransferase)